MARGLPADSHDELVQALFSDGLSTRTQVTDISGRGVGLSALNQATQELGGEITIESTTNVGTTIVFTFPSAEITENDASRRAA